MEWSCKIISPTFSLHPNSLSSEQWCDTHLHMSYVQTHTAAISNFISSVRHLASSKLATRENKMSDWWMGTCKILHHIFSSPAVSCPWQHLIYQQVWNKCNKLVLFSNSLTYKTDNGFSWDILIPLQSHRDLSNVNLFIKLQITSNKIQSTVLSWHIVHVEYEQNTAVP